MTDVEPTVTAVREPTDDVTETASEKLPNVPLGTVSAHTSCAAEADCTAHVGKPFECEVGCNVTALFETVTESKLAPTIVMRAPVVHALLARAQPPSTADMAGAGGVSTTKMVGEGTAAPLIRRDTLHAPEVPAGTL